jgi:hypothetical protein
MALGRGEILLRPVNTKSARMFVIACEGEVAEKRYFEDIVEEFKLQRVQVRVLDPQSDVRGKKSSRSSPLQVLQRMNSFIERNERYLKFGDELWLVMDIDHHRKGKHQHNLRRALQLAQDADYSVAVSNPRFELWLLLHFTELPTAEDCLLKGWLEQEIVDLGGFNPKKSINIAVLRDGVTAAIERARAKDTNDQSTDPDSVLPGLPGSHVYRLMENLGRAEATANRPTPFLNSS